jgi:hypothetical protein
VPRRLSAAVLAITIGLVAAACTEETPADAPTPVATRLPVFSVASSATPEATETARMTNVQVAALLRDLVCWHDDPARAAECLPVGLEEVEVLAQIAETRDPRFIAPLVDMMWIELGWERWVQEALTAITGLEFEDGYGWSAWIAIERPLLPDGYVEWKGRLLSLVDERYAELLSDELLLAVRPDEFVWSRVAIDEQVPLVDPDNVHHREERFLDQSDVVFGIFLNGEARAYPQRILAWHELVTDEVGGRPLVVTNCVPCGGTVVYAATASDGEHYEFGNTGLVYRSRRLFYDRETNSLWDQLTGKAIAGDALVAGASLTPVPVLRTTWGEWAARHPNTTVLSLDTGFARNYDAGVALAEELRTDAPVFPAPVPSDVTVAAKERMIGLEIDGVARAYPVAAIEEAGIVHDTLDGQDVALVSRGPGLGVSVYREHGITIAFLRGELDALEAVDSEGKRWFLDEEVLVNVIDSRLRRAIPIRIAYWFAWADAYPETTLWEG